MRRIAAAFFVLSALGLASRLPAQTGQWQVTKLDYAAPNALGERFDLAARVDGEALLEVKGDVVAYRVLSGQAPQDAGTKMTRALPAQPVSGLQVQQLSGRAPIQIVQRPTAENDWALLVHINDTEAGSDVYRLRASWRALYNSSGSGGSQAWSDLNLWNDDRMQTIVRGVGSLSIGSSPAVPISSASIDLRDDKRFTIQMRGAQTYALEGQWQDAGERGIALNIDRAAGRVVDASGVIRRDSAGLDRIELGADRYDDVVGTLRITETDANQIKAPLTGQAEPSAEPITETVQGAGRYVSNARTKNFDAMEVYLYENGRAQFQIFGAGIKQSFGGAWQRQDSTAAGQERYSISLDRAFDDLQSDGSGVVLLGANKHVDEVTLQGRSTQGNRSFRLSFHQR